jgi:DNA-directed RNA polymerase subunit RPC12/RpoP
VQVSPAIRVETVWEEPGRWCPECQDTTATAIVYTIGLKTDLAVGTAVGCPDCGTRL